MHRDGETNGVANGVGVKAEASAPELSVVVATYNRANLLRELLADLEKQSLPPHAFEVVIVDDGSKSPVKPALAGEKTSYALRVIEQSNAGPAAARHHGISEARADVILIVDDDMRLPETLLEEHLRRHR
ncbi:MAG: glycosyltransferase family A protein, partial [Polyangiaceae bacterium]